MKEEKKVSFAIILSSGFQTVDAKTQSSESMIPKLNFILNFRQRNFVSLKSFPNTGMPDVKHLYSVLLLTTIVYTHHVVLVVSGSRLKTKLGTSQASEFFAAL